MKIEALKLLRSAWYILLRNLIKLESKAASLALFGVLVATACSSEEVIQYDEFLASPQNCSEMVRFNLIPEGSNYFDLKANGASCVSRSSSIRMVELSGIQIKRLTELARSCGGIYVQEDFEYLFLTQSFRVIIDKNCSLLHQDDKMLLAKIAPYFIRDPMKKISKGGRVVNDFADIPDPFSDVLANNVVAIYQTSSADLGLSRLCLVKDDPNLGSGSDLYFEYDRIAASKMCVEAPFIQGA